MNERGLIRLIPIEIMLINTHDIIKKYDKVPATWADHSDHMAEIPRDIQSSSK